MQLLANAKQQFIDQNGLPLASGTVGFYYPGTLNPKPTYEDPAGTIANTNPVLLDSRGQAVIWGSGVYRQIVKDTSGVTIWDQITEDANAGLTGNMTNARWVAGASYTDPVGATPGTFVPGTTTSFNLPSPPGSVANISPYFDGTFQQDDQISSVNGSTLVFASAVPNGIQAVEVKIGTTIAVGVPGSGSVNDASIAIGSKLYNRITDLIDVKDYGATGNGTTPDQLAIAAASTVASSKSGEFLIPSGTYYIGANLTLNARAIFQAGAKLIIPNGITVAFNAGLEAPVDQIFSMPGIGTVQSGIVTINATSTPSGYAEWWGAQTGNNTIDNAPMIMAAHVALVDVQLMPATYYTQTTVKLYTSGHTVSGAIRNFTAGNVDAAAIVQTMPTPDVVQIGPDTQPTTLSQSNTGIRSVTLGRSVAPNVAATPAGLRTQWCTWADIQDIYTYDSRFGFVFTGTGQAHMHRVNATRYTAGTGGADQFWGIWVDGSTNVGYAGGNASLYIDNAVVGATITIADSQGVVANGAFGYSDLFIDRIETANLGLGIQIIGNGNTGIGDVQNEDVQINTVVLDTCSIAGIKFVNTSAFGSIRVDGGFIGFNPSAASPSGIAYQNSKGIIEVTGIEIECIANVTSVGTSSTNSDGINQHDNCVLECASPNAVYELSATSNSRFADAISNNQAGSSSPAPAMTITAGCVRNVFDMQIRGAAGRFSVGYHLDNTTGYNEVKCSRINPGVLLGQKLDYNGTPITTAGTFGTGQLASGIMN